MNKKIHPRDAGPGVTAYRNRGFLDSRDARSLRILAEYLEPESRFRDAGATWVIAGVTPAGTINPVET